MVKKVLICFCCSIVLVLTGISQAVSVKGKVTDDKGTPVAGVSVMEKNTSRGTITSADGTFNLSAPKGTR